MITILAIIFVLGILVFVHELGHFFAARSVGVRVERFSLGYPPRLATFTPTEEGWIFQLFFYRKNEVGKWEWGPVLKKTLSRIPRKATETEYSIALVPLGGYVKMAGTIDESLEDEITGAPDELSSKNRLQQGWVMSAGVMMNLILAVLIYAAVSWGEGVMTPVDEEPIVGTLSEGLPADNIGIQAGDKIVSIGSEDIHTWEQMTSLIHASPRDTLLISWLRNETLFTASVVPIGVKDVCDCQVMELGFIGIAPVTVEKEIGLIEAISMGLSITGKNVSKIYNSVCALVTGNAPFSDLGGPILIAQMAGKSARAGFLSLLLFTAFISINLAFVNILPIPGLDGGHLLLVLLEGLVRRKFSVKVRIRIQQIGMAFLLLLILSVIYNDIARILN
ncbi:MAG: RIP metalloprotease RseP [Fidelibacterota bacterium]